MAPLPVSGHGILRLHTRSTTADFGDWRRTNNKEVFVVEGWGEGFVVGALLIMCAITLANMRRGVLLHKLILVELLFALSHGTFCFMSFDGYGWYLSSTAALLYCSYFTHNVVAWLKIRPFFTEPQASFSPRVCFWVTRIYLGTLILTIPPIIYQIVNNFLFFNNISTMYERVRPYEALMRDPWWIFSNLTFLHVIRKVYSLNVFRLVQKSPRFGILLVAMFLAIVFTIMDILASTVRGLSLTDGINPYWKLALVFKCLTDNIMLDDFKAVLQRLGALKLDGSNHVMMPNSLNLSPNEKAGATDDDADQHIESLDPDERNRLEMRRTRMSLSGRELDEGEELDQLGRSRRRQSMANSAVGKLGIKARRLGTFKFLKSSAEREAERNMKKNKHDAYDTRQDHGELPCTGSNPADRSTNAANRRQDSVRTSAHVTGCSRGISSGSISFITNALDTPSSGARG